jgi:type II secretory pathway pseudopilin PulG
MVPVAIIATISTIAVPQLLDARRNSNKRVAIGSLRTLATDQETYRADYSKYATITQLKMDKKVDLTFEKAGYVFTDLIKEPNEEFYAVVASPATWNSSGKSHYIITSEYTIRECTDQQLPFANLKANQESIDKINQLEEAR